MSADVCNSSIVVSFCSSLKIHKLLRCINCPVPGDDKTEAKISCINSSTTRAIKSIYNAQRPHLRQSSRNSQTRVRDGFVGTLKNASIDQLITQPHDGTEEENESASKLKFGVSSPLNAIPS